MPPIVKVENSSQYGEAARLIEAYGAYIDSMGFDDCITGDIQDEISNLERVYPNDKGGIYIVYWDNEAAGCVAIEEQEPGIAEIRRLYVSRAFRGKELGKQLIAHAVEEARELGYRKVRLDTFKAVDYAANIYRELGFNEVPPFNQLPPEKVVFMEQTL
jgi:ribosomal protein S18 acetylase RimI-like enzyme